MKLCSRKHATAAGCCCGGQSHGAGDTRSAEDAHTHDPAASMPDTPAPPDPTQPVPVGGSHGRHGTHGHGC
jgi:hypothetical protein